MRFPFLELPGERARLPRPVLSVQIDDFVEAPSVCLVDTGATTTRFGRSLAGIAGIDLADAPLERIAVAGFSAIAWHARVDLTVAGVRYDAPVTFCDPWPFAFGLLGQEGFLRFFRVTLCAREFWLDVEPEEV